MGRHKTAHTKTITVGDVTRTIRQWSKVPRIDENGDEYFMKESTINSRLKRVATRVTDLTNGQIVGEEPMPIKRRARQPQTYANKSPKAYTFEGSELMLMCSKRHLLSKSKLTMKLNES